MTTTTATAAQLPATPAYVDLEAQVQNVNWRGRCWSALCNHYERNGPLPIAFRVVIPVIAMGFGVGFTISAANAEEGKGALGFAAAVFYLKAVVFGCCGPSLRN